MKYKSALLNSKITKTSGKQALANMINKNINFIEMDNGKSWKVGVLKSLDVGELRNPMNFKPLKPKFAFMKQQREAPQRGWDEGKRGFRDKQ